MVSFYNPYGKIDITESYFAELVAEASKSAVGVAGMAAQNPADSLKSVLCPDFAEKGVRVAEENGSLLIDLHIKVVYGINIKEAVKSITHKVRYVVEKATGFPVKKVNVWVDDVVS